MNFIDVLTTELRSQSKKTYLFEEISKGYRNEMIQIFQKALKDESFSFVSYLRIAEALKGYNEAEIAEEFLSHGLEESRHFQELLEYASKVQIIDELCIKFNYNYKMPGNDLESIITWKQDLENEAMTDYLKAAEIAFKEGDILTQEFFKELAKDESNHIDNLLKYTDIGSEYLEI